MCYFWLDKVFPFCPGNLYKRISSLFFKLSHISFFKSFSRFSDVAAVFLLPPSKTHQETPLFTFVKIYSRRDISFFVVVVFFLKIESTTTFWIRSTISYNFLKIFIWLAVETSPWCIIATYVWLWWGSQSCMEASLGPPVAGHQCTMGDPGPTLGNHHRTIVPMRTGTKLFAALDCQTSE